MVMALGGMRSLATIRIVAKLQQSPTRSALRAGLVTGFDWPCPNSPALYPVEDAIQSFATWSILPSRDDTSHAGRGGGPEALLCAAHLVEVLSWSG